VPAGSDEQRVDPAPCFLFRLTHGPPSPKRNHDAGNRNTPARGAHGRQGRLRGRLRSTPRIWPKPAPSRAPRRRRRESCRHAGGTACRRYPSCRARTVPGERFPEFKRFRGTGGWPRGGQFALTSPGGCQVPSPAGRMEGGVSLGQ
jgi:hypothetical protein